MMSFQGILLEDFGYLSMGSDFFLVFLIEYGIIHQGIQESQLALSLAPSAKTKRSGSCVPYWSQN